MNHYCLAFPTYIVERFLIVKNEEDVAHMGIGLFNKDDVKVRRLNNFNLAMLTPYVEMSLNISAFPAHIEAQ